MMTGADEENEQRHKSGFLLKHRPEFITWNEAMLRHAGLDNEGYYLKVDGRNAESGEIEQLYLYLTENDVALVVAQWKKIVETEGSGWARFCLKSQLESE